MMERYTVEGVNMRVQSNTHTESPSVALESSNSGLTVWRHLLLLLFYHNKTILGGHPEFQTSSCVLNFVSILKHHNKEASGSV
jgi:hypothetical protein